MAKTRQRVEIYIPTEFNLIEMAEQVNKLARTHDVVFLDRPPEEWAKDPFIPQTKEHFEDMLHHIFQHQDLAVDVETNGLSFVDPKVRIVGYVVTTRQHSYYIPVRHITNEPQLDHDFVLQHLREVVFDNPLKRLIFHNVKFDYNQLLKEGVDLYWRFKEGSIFDTQIGSWLVDENQKEDKRYYYIIPGKPAQPSHWVKGLNGHANKAKENGAVLLQGYSLKVLGPKWLGIPMTKFEDMMEIIGFDKIPIHFGGKYARLDGFTTLKLFDFIEPKLREEKLWDVYTKVEMPFAWVIANMERRGLGVSPRILKRIGDRCKEEMDELRTKIYQIAGEEFNISSTQQLGKILYEKLGYPIIARTAKGQPKTDADTLDKLAKMGYELPKLLKRVSELETTYTRYVIGFYNFIDVDGRIHGSLDQTGTVTGRLSSYDPNLQNLTSFPIFEDELDKEQMIQMRKEIGDSGISKIFDFTVHFVDEDGEPLPMEEGWEEKCVAVKERWFIRDAFTELDYLNEPPVIEDDGIYLNLKEKCPLWGTIDGYKTNEELVYIVSDYSQMELRMMAHFSKDPILIEAFRMGQDIHRRTAAEVFEVDFEHVTSKQRRQAKAVNFGLIYGKTAFGFAVDWYSDEPDFWEPCTWNKEGRQPAKKYIEEAQKFIDRYFERLPDVHAYMEKVANQGEKYGYIRTLLGRKRRIPDIFSEIQSEKNKARRQFVNTKIQGSAADFIKKAMVDMEFRFKEENIFAFQLLQVHDEVVIVTKRHLVDKVLPIIKDCMENLFKDQMNCPIETDPKVVYRYGSAK